MGSQLYEFTKIFPISQREVFYSDGILSRQKGPTACSVSSERRRQDWVKKIGHVSTER